MVFSSWCERHFKHLSPEDRQIAMVLTGFSWAVVVPLILFFVVIRIVLGVDDGRRKSVTWLLSKVVVISVAASVPLLIRKYQARRNILKHAGRALLLFTTVGALTGMYSSPAPLCSNGNSYLLITTLFASLLMPVKETINYVFVLALALLGLNFAKPSPNECLINPFASFFGVILLLRLVHKLAQFREKQIEVKHETNAYLMSVMFHEVRTPMQIILSSLLELKESSLPKAECALVRTLYAQVHHLAAIQTLIDEYQSLNRDYNDMQARPCCIRPLISGLLSARRDTEAACLYTSTDIPMDLNVSLDWHQTRFALSLLIDCVLSLNPASKVWVHSSMRGHRLTVSVQSTKPDSMSDAHFADSVTLLDSTRVLNHRNFKGQTDVRLILYRRIVQALHGTSRLRYDEADNTLNFFMSIPVTICSEYTTPQSRPLIQSEPLPTRIPVLPPVQPLATDTDSSEEGDSPSSSRTSDHQHSDTSPADTPHAAPTILIAEDNAMISQILTSFVTALGYQAVTVADGAEAVEQTLKTCPDLIIMDIHMPSMNGIDAARALRQHGNETPIIALSAGGLNCDVEQCRESGFQGFYTKPIGRDALAEAIEYHMAAPKGSWRGKLTRNTL